MRNYDVLRGLKKYQPKSGGNKPELIGRLLKKWKDSSASVDRCCNFARMNMSYVQAGSKLAQTS